jgi:hypothetical protein
MARVVQGNPLYTSEEFNPEKSQPQRVVRDQGTKLARFLQGLQTAEAVASSKALGAVAGLAMKGIGKIGTAIEEAGKVAQAERAVEEQQALNKKEADRAYGVARALQEAAKQKRAEAEPSTPADQGEMEATQRAFTFREGQKEAYEDLNKAYQEYKADASKAKELGDKVRKYVGNKVLSEDEAKYFFAGLERKAKAREQELLDLEKQTTKKADVEAERFGTAVAKAEVEATKAKRDKVLAERARQNKALKEAIPLLQLAQQEEEYAKLMGEEEQQGMVVPTARRVGVVDENTALEGAGTRPANLANDMTSGRAERLQLAQQYRKQAEALLSPLGLKADNLPPIAELTEEELKQLQYLSPEEIKKVVAPFKAETQAERAGLTGEAKQKGFRPPPGPAEPTAPQPPAEEPAPFRTGINIPQEQLKDVLTRGQGKEKEFLVKSLQALQDLAKKQPLSANQTEYARLATEYLRNLVNAEREGKGDEYLKTTREEMLQAGTPESADVSGKVTAKGKVVAPEFDTTTGEQLTKAGQKIKQIPAMKAKPKTQEQLRAEMEAVRTGMPPAGVSVESYEIPELAEMEARVERVKKAGGTDQAILKEYPEFKDLTAQEVVKLAVEEPDQARRAKLLEQATQLEERANERLAQSQEALKKQATLPEGVSIDPKTGGFVIERKTALSENELQALAANANTLEKRAEVLRQVENADVAPETIMDIMTGGHKKRFAEKLRPFFPTSRDFPKKSAGEIEAEILLKQARRGKILKETAEIEANAKSKRAKEKAGADADIARADDLREKGGAKVNNVGYWESVIIRNLRKPNRVSGKSAADRAKATLNIIERDRASQTAGVNKYHDNKIEVEENRAKELNAKYDALVKDTGETPTPPAKPDIESLTSSTARTNAEKDYAKQKREYDDQVKAIADIKKARDEANDAVKKAKEDKESELTDLNDAYDKAETKVRSQAGVPERPISPRSPRKEEKKPEPPKGGGGGKKPKGEPEF